MSKELDQFRYTQKARDKESKIKNQNPYHKATTKDKNIDKTQHLYVKLKAVDEVKKDEQFTKEAAEFHISETNSLFDEDVDENAPLPYLIDNSEFENSSIFEVKTSI